MLIDEKIDTHLLASIFEKHSIEKAYIFGSASKGSLTINSDIDFLIRFKSGIPPLQRGELWWSLYDTLRNLFQRKIDLINENSLKNPYFIQEVNKTKKLIY